MLRLVLASKCFRLILVFANGLLLMACEPSKPRSGFSSLLVQQGRDVTQPARLVFPEDHLAHPEYGIEWWYLTANLTNQNNDPLWLQWTMFRVRNNEAQNSWSDSQFYMAHFSLHSLERHSAREMFASGGVGNAGVDSGAITINNWHLNKTSSGLPASLIVSYLDEKTDSQVSVELKLESKSHYLLQGDNGYSLKHPETDLASYYYSLPYIKVTGGINFSGEIHEVIGIAWYDHEWSSMFLSQDFSGWTWFSIHLQDNSKLTLFTLFPSEGSPYSDSWYGALMTKDGQTIKTGNNEIFVQEHTWQETALGKLPTSWHIRIESLSLDLQLKVKKPQQISPFSIPYYEGAVEVTGSQKGVGFVEMTR